ncbi:unnamed protein product [Gadus morhua 'NCC']
MQMYSNTLRSEPVIHSEVRQLRGETAQRGDSSEGGQLRGGTDGPPELPLSCYVEASSPITLIRGSPFPAARPTPDPPAGDVITDCPASRGHTPDRRDRGVRVPRAALSEECSPLIPDRNITSGRISSHHRPPGDSPGAESTRTREEGRGGERGRGEE